MLLEIKTQTIDEWWSSSRKTRHQEDVDDSDNYDDYTTQDKTGSPVIKFRRGARYQTACYYSCTVEVLVGALIVDSALKIDWRRSKFQR